MGHPDYASEDLGETLEEQNLRMSMKYVSPRRNDMILGLGDGMPKP